MRCSLAATAADSAAAFLAEDQPRHHASRSTNNEHQYAEGVMPALIDDPPGRHRYREVAPRRRALRWDLSDGVVAASRLRNSLRNRVVATAAAGPSPAPRMARQIGSMVKLTVPTMEGAPAPDDAGVDDPSMSTRLTMRPTTITGDQKRGGRRRRARPMPRLELEVAHDRRRRASPTTIFCSRELRPP